MDVMYSMYFVFSYFMCPVYCSIDTNAYQYVWIKKLLLPLFKIVLQRTSVFMYKLMNNMLPLAMNSLVVRNNDIHHYNTRENHHLRGSRPTCKTVVHSFTNRSFQIWNAISSKVNINVSLYKFKYNVKLFLLENELMITYQY